MSAISSIQNNTIYFEQVVREQIKTQEIEARAEFKDRESEMREVKAQKTMNGNIIEELRPLCEELPERLIDPITLEPINKPIIMRCSHAFDSLAFSRAMRAKNLTKQDRIPCPICRTETKGTAIIQDIYLMESISRLRKIKGVFKYYATQETINKRRLKKAKMG